jgi:serine/threonine-protein kinase RsbW
MAAKQTVFRMTLRSNPKQISKVGGFLHKIAQHVRLDEIQTHKVMVSLTEAVNNAITHGNKADPKKRVTVICELLPGWLLFQIIDEGKGFKLERVRNPLKEENLLRENGRGIFLMRTLMDKVEYEISHTGVELRLWLDLGK